MIFLDKNNYLILSFRLGDYEFDFKIKIMLNFVTLLFYICAAHE